MRGTWIGSGGVHHVHLPTVIAEKFMVTRSEARRLLAQGAVSLDGETTERVDLPVEDVEGRELRISSRQVVQL